MKNYLFKRSDHVYHVIDLAEDYINTEGQLISQEERQRGKVSKKIYLMYMKACGYVMSAFLLFIMTSTQAIKVYTDFWLSEWSSASSHPSDPDEQLRQANVTFAEAPLNVSSAEVSSKLHDIV